MFMGFSFLQSGLHVYLLYMQVDLICVYSDLNSGHVVKNVACLQNLYI